MLLHLCVHCCLTAGGVSTSSLGSAMALSLEGCACLGAMMREAMVNAALKKHSKATKTTVTDAATVTVTTK